MPIINPNVICYRNLISPSGRRFELRLTRGEIGTASNDNAYKYGVDNPSEVLYINDLVIPPDKWGNTGMEEFDEDADSVPISFDFSIADQLTFSGVLGDATVITEQNLRTEHTTLLSNFFNHLNDKDPDTGKFLYNYHVHKSWIDEDYAMEEIYYHGTIDPEKLNKSPYYREKSMTDQEVSLYTWHLQTCTIATVLSHLFIQDLVESLRQSDMMTTHRKAWYGGAIVATLGSRPYSKDMTVGVYDYHDLGRGKFTGRIYEIFPDNPSYGSSFGYVPCSYPYDRDEDSSNQATRTEAAFSKYKNCYGVEHGLQGLSYGVLMSKIASLGGFVFNTSTDKPLVLYSPSYHHPVDATHEGYKLSAIGDTYWDGYIGINYNTFFGIRPDELFINEIYANSGDYSDGGNLEFREHCSIDLSSPAILTLSSPATLYPGQRIVLGTGASFPDAEGRVVVRSVIDDTHVTLEWGNDFDPGDHAPGSPVVALSAYSDFVVQWVADGYYAALQTPITYPRNNNLNTLLTDIFHRFVGTMEWDIAQSGANIGQNVLTLKDLLTGTHDAPAAWQDPQNCPKLPGGDVENLPLTKVAVKVFNKGNDKGAVYCPRKPKVGEEVIEREIFTRLKKWGEWDGYAKDNFINDATKDVLDQQGSRYRIDQFGNWSGNPLASPEDSMGWLLGANDFYLYISDPGIYGTWYNPDHALMDGETGNDSTGFYAISYQKYHGRVSSPLDLDEINQDYFNTLVEPAILFANYYLLSKSTDNRSMRGIWDDSGSTRKLLRRLKTHWRDSDGNVTYKRATKLYINELTEKTTAHFVTAKADDSVIDPQFDKYVIDEGTPGGGSSIGGGSHIGGGGATVDISESLIKHPTTDDRDFITLNFDTIGGGVNAYSAQTKDLWQYRASNATTIYSGISAGGTFFSNLQDAIELRPYGTSAGNTGEIRLKTLAVSNKYAAFKAADAMSANNTYTLPDTYPASSGRVLSATTAGVMSWIPMTDLSAAVLITPLTANRNLIQPGATGVIPLQIKGFTGSSSRLIQIQTSTGQDILHILSGGLINFTGSININAISSSTSLGLDTGATIDFGTSGQVLASGGSSGLLHWVANGLQYWTESQNTSSPNNTINATRLLVTGGSTNNDAVIQPKGTGALLAHLPDGTTTGGDKRGAHAVDLQTLRSMSSEVASGTNAAILGGADNQASSNYGAVLGGLANFVQGDYSSIGGGVSNTVSGQYSCIPGGASLVLTNDGNFGFLSGAVNAMVISTDNIATFGNVDLWLANNDNSARALKFWAPWNTAGAFPSTNKFAAIKAGVVTTSYTWILPLADSAGYLKSDGSGNLSIDSLSSLLADAIIRIPLTDARNLIRPNADVLALSLSAAGITTKHLMNFLNGADSLVSHFDTQGTLQLGTFGSFENNAQMLAVWGAGGSPAVILREGGGDILRWMPASSSSTVLGKITSVGAILSTATIATSGSVGAGTQTPSFVSHFKEGTRGVVVTRFENDSKTDDILFDSVTTTNNTNTIIHNFSIPNTKDRYNVKFIIEAEQTGGAGGVVGHRYTGEFIFVAENTAGVVSIVRQLKKDVVEDADAEAGLWVVSAPINGTSIDVKVQSPNNNRTIKWNLLAWSVFKVNFA